MYEPGQDAVIQGKLIYMPPPPPLVFPSIHPSTPFSLSIVSFLLHTS